MFKDFVTCINFETSSFCNRCCAYCPVAYEGAREQRFMKEQVFEKIVGELVRIDYRGIISLSLYNEPLASEDIIHRAKRINKDLPWCYIKMNSNGDYLSSELLDKLCCAGVKELLVTLHMGEGEEYTDEIAKKKFQQFFGKLNMSYEIAHMKTNHNITCDLMHNGMRLLVVTNNWLKDGNARGGAVERLKINARKSPCAMPFREIAIDIDGNFRLCCNVYVTSTPMNNIHETSIVDFFFSEDMIEYRKNLLKWGNKCVPCNICSAYDYSMQFSEMEWNALLKKIGTKKGK